MSFFFTLLDDSLRPQGSRDPLGLEHVWSQTGRRLIGNLTTVTGNLDNFIVALLGFHLCKTGDKNPPLWPRFQRYEQIMARSRYRFGGATAASVLGSRQIGRSKDQNPVFLGGTPEARILSDQKQSGLWGIYSSALCATGLTDGDRSPTSAGADTVETFLDELTEGEVGWLMAALDKKQVQLMELDTFGKALAKMLSADEPRSLLLRRLLDGGITNTRGSNQMELHRLASQYLAEGNPSNDLRSFFSYLKTHSTLLGDYAGRIIEMESVLILARRVFDFLLRGHGTPMTELVSKLQRLEKWPERSFLAMPVFPEIDNEPWRRRAATLTTFADAVRCNSWDSAVDALLKHHASVMGKRGGAGAWAFEEAGALKVIFGSPGTVLPTDQELTEDVAGWWDNSYFVTSFLSLLSQGAAPGGGV